MPVKLIAGRVHMEEYLRNISIASLNDKKYPVLGCPD